MARAMATRRAFLQAGGLALAGFALPCVARAGVVRVHMKSDVQGAEVWFDPIGLLIAPGQTVRWVVDANVHTTTAYHPQNDMHSLRIPEGAMPWDSGFLVNPGQHFDVTFTVEASTTTTACRTKRPGWLAASSWGDLVVRAHCRSTTSRARRTRRGGSLSHSQPRSCFRVSR